MIYLYRIGQDTYGIEAESKLKALKLLFKRYDHLLAAYGGFKYVGIDSVNRQIKSDTEQWRMIYEHCKVEPITTIEAVYLYGITRLAEIVRQVELNTGKRLEREWVKKNGKKFKKYYLK